MKPLFFLISGLLFLPLQSLYGQNTSIPDANFEQALVDLGIDSDGVVDGDVLTADINTLTELNVFSRNIQDLTGIEDFSSLEILNCSINRLGTIDLSANTALINLNISSNLLNSLDISANTLLEVLKCQDNLLTSLDLSSNGGLTALDVTLNNLAAVDLSGLGSLRSFKCSGNQISALDLSANTQLTELICSSNQISALNVGSNTLLTTLFCASNQIALLDLNQNSDLTFLDCSDNQIGSLDVINNPLLEQLTASANQLMVLDLSQNDSLQSLNISNNQLSMLDISMNTQLENLSAGSNLLRNFDAGSNSTLASVDLSSNLIGFLDLGNNPTLTSVDCSANLLEYLNISNGNNAAINTLNAANNPMLFCILVDNPSQTGSLWIKDAAAGYSASCDLPMTLIADANFEQALIDLGYDTGPINGSVVTDSIAGIAVLDVSALNISDLTGIEDFSGLTDLDCSNNQLTELDLTNNANLTDLDGSDNMLISLNIKNGNNANINSFDARNNPALLCITVDDQTQNMAGWLKDAGASFADNCHPGSTFIPNDQFEQALIDMGLDTLLNNYVATDSISSLTFIDLSGRNIRDLTGIADFAALDSLDCSSNQLFDLDLSQNPGLTYVSCFSNYLSQIDVSNQTSLVNLNTGDNRLISIDISANTALEELIIGSNFLTALDVSSNTALLRLNCNSNSIDNAGFDISANVNLQELLCANNRLSSVNISQNTQLMNLDVSGNLLQALDIAQNILLRKLDASSNFLSVLNVNSNTLIDSLILNANHLQTLSLTANPLLEYLNAGNNNLSTLDLSTNTNLRTLLLSSNGLSVLDISNSGLLNVLHFDNNQVSILDLSANTDLLDLSCSRNQLSDLDLSSNTSLLRVNCEENNLSVLDISANTSLVDLSLTNNQVSLLNTANATALERLNANQNNLSALDLSANTLLAELSCSGNRITDLDLGLLNQLTSVNCSNNALMSVNIRNGNNASLSTFNAINNPDLKCIQVDDENAIGTGWQKEAAAVYSNNCRYSDTYVPDDNFEAALALITGQPDNNDDYIATSGIEGLTTLDVSNQGIADLTGIEDFLVLQNLDISNNNLDSIYLTNNTMLSLLHASANNLQNIDLEKNQDLTDLDLSMNQLSELSVDSLEALTLLNLSSNQIISLDLDNNTSLASVNCSSNILTSLSIKNGNNAGLTTLDATSNSDLLCIEIDDVNAIGAGWVVDPAASFSENCHYNETFVPDDNFEAALIALGYDQTSTGPPDDYVPTAKIQNAITLNISSRGISDLTGLQDFENLENLNCRNNDLNSLPVENNLKLEILNISGNLITNLDVSMLDSLRILDVSGNLLSSLDVSQNQILQRLIFSDNQLTGIDITQNTMLTQVSGQVNNLFSVDANSGSNATLLTFDLRENPSLTCILVDNVAAANSYPNWHKDPQAFYRLVCDDDDNDGVDDTEDLCPATPFGSQVDLFGCAIFSLPVNNFTIKTTSESCRARNNGKINITADTVLSYTATLISELDSVTTYNFGDKVEIRNVRAGRYELCIAVNGQPGYNQCYSLLITQPEDLKVFSTGRRSNGRVVYEMSGSESYIIEFNERVLETTESEISLPLEKGKNLIRIHTGLYCQGVFEEILYYQSEIVPFPNPFQHEIRVNLGEMGSVRIRITIYTTSGKVLINRDVENNDGSTRVIDTSDLPAGIYILEVKGVNELAKFKIIKQ